MLFKSMNESIDLHCADAKKMLTSITKTVIIVSLILIAL